MKTALLFAALLASLVVTNARTTWSDDSGCYLKLFSVQYNQGKHYDDGGRGSTVNGLSIGRKRLKRFTVRSLRVIGQGNFCCFKLFSSKAWRGSKRVVFGGEKFDTIRDTDLTKVKSFRKMREE